MNLTFETVSTNKTHVAGTLGKIASFSDTVLMLKKMCYWGIVPCFIFIGLVFNSLCLAMFSRLANKTSTVIMLMGLATIDILTLLMAGVNSLMYTSKLYGFPLTQEQRIRTMIYYSFFINPIPGRAGNILTLVISCERLFCVVLPLKITLQYSTKKTAIIAVACSYILSTIACLPFAFLYTTSEIFLNATGQYVVILKPTSFGMNTELVDTVFITLESIMKNIPVLGVMVFSSITSLVVVITSRRRLMISEIHSMSKSSKKEIKVTKTLLVITFVYVVCQMPETISRVIVFTDPETKLHRSNNNAYEIASTSTYMMFLLNSVVNFIIYYKTSAVYKAKFQSMFGCVHQEHFKTTVVTNE